MIIHKAFDGKEMKFKELCEGHCVLKGGHNFVSVAIDSQARNNCSIFTNSKHINFKMAVVKKVWLHNIKSIKASKSDGCLKAISCSRVCPRMCSAAYTSTDYKTLGVISEFIAENRNLMGSQYLPNRLHCEAEVFFCCLLRKTFRWWTSIMLPTN